MKGDTTSKFWIFVLPALLCGIIFYAYSKGGFFSRWVRSIVDPLINLAQAIVHIIFGINF
jgi:hypothetical protein